MDDIISQVRAEGILIGIAFVVVILIIRAIAKKRSEDNWKLEQLYREMLYKNYDMQREFDEFRRAYRSNSDYRCLLKFFSSQERVNRALEFKQRHRDVMCHMKDLEKELGMRVNWTKANP